MTTKRILHSVGIGSMKYSITAAFTGIAMKNKVITWFRIAFLGILVSLSRHGPRDPMSVGEAANS